MTIKPYQFAKIVALLFLYSLSAGAEETGVTVTRVEQLPKDLSIINWDSAPIYEAGMLAQQMAMPALTKASIEKVNVQALTDGERIAWRLAWADAQPDANVDAGRFSDAVAMEFPLSEGAAPMMGHQGAKVQILYWKGLWQKDQDEGFQDVQLVHPNYWSDLYWFASGSFPYKTPDAFENPISHLWFPAYQAGNPMSVFSRLQPVEELVAEGWGTLTHQPENVTTAQGVWRDGQWTVMFSRPLSTDDPNDHQFKSEGQLALAVWQGSEGNAGGRKHWSNWINYRMQP